MIRGVFMGLIAVLILYLAIVILIAAILAKITVDKMDDDRGKK